jgi:hypothetical protein
MLATCIHVPVCASFINARSPPPEGRTPTTKLPCKSLEEVLDILSQAPTRRVAGKSAASSEAAIKKLQHGFDGDGVVVSTEGLPRTERIEAVLKKLGP